MRTRLVLLALLAVVVTGCGGGGGKKTEFTNANWGELEFNVQQGMYNGSPVDFVGQVYLVELNEPGAVWFMVYADAKGQNYRTLVKYPDTQFMVQNDQLVHVVGKVAQDTQTPDMIMWDAGPVILASKATVVTQPSG